MVGRFYINIQSVFFLSFNFNLDGQNHIKNIEFVSNKKALASFKTSSLFEITDNKWKQQNYLFLRHPVRY